MSRYQTVILFLSPPPVRTNIIYKLSWNTMHNSFENHGLNIGLIRKKKNSETNITPPGSTVTTVYE